MAPCLGDVTDGETRRHLSSRVCHKAPPKSNRLLLLMYKEYHSFLLSSASLAERWNRSCATFPPESCTGLCTFDELAACYKYKRVFTAHQLNGPNNSVALLLLQLQRFQQTQKPHSKKANSHVSPTRPLTQTHPFCR